MKLPDDVKAIRSRYVAAFPLPQGEPSPEQEERVRAWSIAFAEQVRYDTGNSSWGVKRSGPTNPISKDTIAKRHEGRLLIWDLCTGTGTGRPTLNEDPESEDITGQQFVGVAPINHLRRVGIEPPAAGGTGEGAEPPAGRGETSGGPDYGAVVAAIEANTAVLRELMTQQKILSNLIIVATEPGPAGEEPSAPAAEPAPLLVALTGTLFGYKVRLEPEYKKG